ncbi:MAG: DUF433 domain-containing protein [Chloroflexota bacterium]
MAIVSQVDATTASPAGQGRPTAEDTAREPLVAFTADQVIRLTGLTERQLRYWDRTGFFTAGYAGNRLRTPYGRIYLYRDVVGLRAIAVLRNEHHVPLQELQRVGAYLLKHHDVPWSSLRVFVGGHHVYFEDPRTGLRLNPDDARQVALPIEMQTVESDTRARALRLRERVPEEIGQITRHRNVESNAWVLAGTRVPTAAVWEFHEAGYGADTILAAYPSLTPPDVQRAIGFERQRHKRVS